MSTDELIAFWRARLDEDEAAVRDHLCINCGEPTAPLRSSLGVTGYTHYANWQGRRCRNRLTGAEPVQDPARALREVEADRAILAMAEEQAGYDLPEGVNDGRDPDERERDEAIAETLGEVARIRVVRFSDHPDYQQEWKP